MLPSAVCTCTFKIWRTFLIVLTPITISILVAAGSRFREGNKWVLLRSSSEAIKSEIFRYRMQAGAYSNDQCLQTSRESKLAARLKDISSALVQSEVNRTNIPSVGEERPNPSHLPQSRRLHEGQNRRSNQVLRRKDRQPIQTSETNADINLYCRGRWHGLAAFHGDVWVALTTAIAAPSRQGLKRIRSRTHWFNTIRRSRDCEISHPGGRHFRSGKKVAAEISTYLSNKPKRALAGELSGWVQQMQTALDKLTEKEEAEAGKDQSVCSQSVENCESGAGRIRIHEASELVESMMFHPSDTARPSSVVALAGRRVDAPERE